jgi:flagellar basal body-associated protein FliL
MKIIKILFVIFIVLFLIGSFAASIPQTASQAIKPYQEQVAIDFEAQYAAVVESGTAIDRCIRAGLVAEGYLQAANTEKYKEWKQVEKADCKAAGVPR